MVLILGKYCRIRRNTFKISVVSRISGRRTLKMIEENKRKQDFIVGEAKHPKFRF
jgi:hypothetical protein